MCPKFTFHPDVSPLVLCFSLPSQRHSESFICDAVILKWYLMSSFGFTQLKPGIELWNTRDLFPDKGILSTRQPSREEFASGRWDILIPLNMCSHILQYDKVRFAALFLKQTGAFTNHDPSQDSSVPKGTA